MKTSSARWGTVILALLVLGPSCGLAQGSREAAKMAAEFAIAFHQEDWLKAVKLGKRWAELSPRNHVPAYNLACAYARSGASDEALTWLEEAAAKGFSDPKRVQEDEDLLSVRDTYRFAFAVQRIQANYDQARSLFADMAKGSEAMIVGPPKGREREEGEPSPMPVLLILHGYGDRTESFTEFFEDFARKEGLLLVGVRSVVPVFTRGFEWGTAIDAELQIRSALDQAAALYPLDRQRIYLLGFSQGGRMALEAVLGEEAPYSGAIVLGAGVRQGFEEELSAGAPPIFLMVGAEDGSVASARRGAKALKSTGHPVDLRVYPGVGHSFPQGWESEIRKAMRWFDSVGRATPSTVE